MKIIIAGAGDAGFHLAKLLAQEGQDIVLVDRSAEKLKYVSSHLDVSTIKGSITSYAILEAANISKADLMICVTSSEDANIASAIIGKHLGAKKTVARINNTEFLTEKKKIDLNQLGIDELISPESLAAREIRRLIEDSALTDTFKFEKGVLQLVGLKIDKYNSLVNKTLEDTKELNPDNNFINVAILRNNETIIPRGNTKVRLNDHAYFIAKPKGIEKILELTGKERVEINRVMILGGGRVGQHTAKQLTDCKIKLIEQREERCLSLAENLPNALIINGDGTDCELLKEESIEKMDAFIAVTGNSETNIISCLLAKKQGVKKTIALVENTDYISLSQSIGIDTLINKKLIAANFILRYIRKGDVVSLTGIHGSDAEIAEFIIKEDSKIINKKTSEINFPQSSIIGGVIREGKSYIPMGNFEFKEADRVVVLGLPECIEEIGNYFN